MLYSIESNAVPSPRKIRVRLAGTRSPTSSGGDDGFSRCWTGDLCSLACREAGVARCSLETCQARLLRAHLALQDAASFTVVAGLTRSFGVISAVLPGSFFRGQRLLEGPAHTVSSASIPKPRAKDDERRFAGYLCGNFAGIVVFVQYT